MIMFSVATGPCSEHRAVATTCPSARPITPRETDRFSAQSSTRCAQPTAVDSACAASRWAGVNATISTAEGAGEGVSPLVMVAVLLRSPEA